MAWAYAAETCCDVSLGVSLLVLYSVVLILSLTTEPLMDSVIQPQGVFFLFAFFSFCAWFFMYYYVPETKGLPEADKKKLFYPGSKWGRKLDEGEQLPYELAAPDETQEIDENWRDEKGNIGNTVTSSML